MAKLDQDGRDVRIILGQLRTVDGQGRLQMPARQREVFQVVVYDCQVVVAVPDIEVTVRKLAAAHGQRFLKLRAGGGQLAQTTEHQAELAHVGRDKRVVLGQDAATDRDG